MSSDAYKVFVGALLVVAIAASFYQLGFIGGIMRADIDYPHRFPPDATPA